MIVEAEVTAKLTTSLLNRLLDHNSLTEQEIGNLLEDAGIPKQSCYALARFTISKCISHEKRTEFPREAVEKGVLSSLFASGSNALGKRGLKVHTKEGLNSLLFLLYGEDATTIDALRSVLAQVRAGILQCYEDCDLFLAFSEPVNNPMSLQASMSELIFTNTLIKYNLTDGPVQAFEDTGSYRFFLHITDINFIYRFRDYYLKKLFLIDQEHSSNLLSTLHTYIFNSCNVKKTAEILYIHRNTLQYRLDRIKSITGLDLNKIPVYRDFLMAFMILDVYPFLNN